MFLGIEIGGTKLQLGVGQGDGTLIVFKRLPVDVAAGSEGIRKQILEAVPTLLLEAKLERSQLKGMAFGFGGPVDDAARKVITSHQVAGWDGFPLAEWAESNLGLPCVLGNDCDVAGLAEALFGAGKGLSPIFYITIGSGIGGGLIIDGETYRGCGKGAAEIGHLRVPFHNLLAASEEAVDLLEVDDLENVSSGWAIERVMRRFAEQSPGDFFGLYSACRGEPSSLTMQDVAKALREERRGEFREDVGHLFRTCIEPLAEAICHVIVLLCPHRIIIGGGVSLMGEDMLFKPLRELVAERAFKPFADCYDIVPAALGEEVVVHGALALARKRFG